MLKEQIATISWHVYKIWTACIRVNWESIFLLPQKRISFEPTTTYLLKDLKPFTTYTFRLAARSKHGVGAYTNEISAETPQTRRSSSLSNWSFIYFYSCEKHIFKCIHFCRTLHNLTSTNISGWHWALIKLAKTLKNLCIWKYVNIWICNKCCQLNPTSLTLNKKGCMDNEQRLSVKSRGKVNKNTCCLNFCWAQKENLNNWWKCCMYIKPVFGSLTVSKGTLQILVSWHCTKDTIENSWAFYVGRLPKSATIFTEFVPKWRSFLTIQKLMKVISKAAKS